MTYNVAQFINKLMRLPFHSHLQLSGSERYRLWSCTTSRSKQLHIETHVSNLEFIRGNGLMDEDRAVQVFLLEDLHFFNLLPFQNKEEEELPLEAILWTSA